MTRSKKWLSLMASVVRIYLGVVVVAYLAQRWLLYFPTHQDVPTRLTPWRVSGELFGYARETASPRRVWLMMPGNGGQAANRDYILPCVAPEDAVYVLEYPGYGFRPGRPTQASLDQAAAEAYRELRRRYPAVPVGVIGESIGSGPACALAHEATTPDRIVLITPFDTLVSVAAEHEWFLPVRLLLKDRWDNVAALRGYRQPVEIFGAAYDRVIPVAHARALATAVGARFVLIPTGHNDWMYAGYVTIDGAPRR